MSHTENRPSLLFVDHYFHRSTKSFDFLCDILSQRFEVKRIFVDPEGDVLQYDRLIDSSEYVVIGQMDFLTPIFIAAGKKVIVVQMYDGSAWLPDCHWELNKQARYLNFSLALHARALAAGAESYYVQFFPDPAKYTPVRDYSKLRGFFWQRLPKSGINLSSVKSLVGNDLDELHVHTPADDGAQFNQASVAGFKCRVTTSNWFEDRDEFDDVMNRCNLFIAPRYAEGIGHAFLEAMARGMIVVAYDLPTHSEYITSWQNGILFSNFTELLELKKKQVGLRKVGENARLTVVNGHQNWLREQELLIDFVEQAPAALAPSHPGLSCNVEQIVASYRAGVGSYTDALARFEGTRTVLGRWRDFEREALHASVQARASSKTMHLFFGCGNGGSFMRLGWANPEQPHRWAVARTAVIYVPVKEDAELTSMTINMRALAKCSMSVEANGRRSSRFSVDNNFRSIEIGWNEPIPITKKEGLTLTFDMPRMVPVRRVEKRPLTFCVSSAALHFQ